MFVSAMVPKTAETAQALALSTFSSSRLSRTEAAGTRRAVSRGDVYGTAGAAGRSATLPSSTATRSAHPGARAACARAHRGAGYTARDPVSTRARSSMSTRARSSMLELDASSRRRVFC